MEFARAIIHIDADAFFASCEQSRDPKLRGKPVVTGKERGIASSMSYEAKAMGVTRAMSLYEIKKVCPDAIILPSDYETYSLLSKRMFDIVRRHTPIVEEYSIDECFADITGLRRHNRCSYVEIAEKIKRELDTELGFTFSIGIAPTKVLAKIGSKWKKPSGLTAISERSIRDYLDKLEVGKVWGIGPQTTAYLEKYNIKTALQYADRSETWILDNLSKPFHEIWQELRGTSVYPVSTEEKTSYASVQKVKTFTPPSKDKTFIFAQLVKNIENACIKIRKYGLISSRAFFFLRTQDFRHIGYDIKFSRATSIPIAMINAIQPIFDRIFSDRLEYRSTGITLMKLEPNNDPRLDLFGEGLKIESWNKIYEAVDTVRERYGKHTLFLGSGFKAHKGTQHQGGRGEFARRTTELFKGETGRRRLGIPMFIGDVN